MMLCAAGITLSVLLLYALSDPQVAGKRFSAWWLLPSTIGAILLCFWSMDQFNAGRIWIGLVVGLFGLALGLLGPPDYFLRRGRRFPRGIFVVVAVLFLAGFWTSWEKYADQQADKRRQAATATEAAERAQAIAKDLGRAKTNWQPGAGVAEARLGPAIAWVAIQPHILVDLAGEREMAVSRRIPVKVALLNNSFGEMAFAAGSGELLWRLDIINRSTGSVVATWDSSSESDGAVVFTPTERRDFTVIWDGRDDTGALAAGGSYAGVFTTAPLAGVGSPIRAEIAFTITDAGPEVVSTGGSPDVVKQWQQSFEQGQRLSKMVGDALQVQQRQFQIDSMLRRR